MDSPTPEERYDSLFRHLAATAAGHFAYRAPGCGGPAALAALEALAETLSVQAAALLASPSGLAVRRVLPLGLALALVHPDGSATVSGPLARLLELPAGTRELPDFAAALAGTPDLEAWDRLGMEGGASLSLTLASASGRHHRLLFAVVAASGSACLAAALPAELPPASPLPPAARASAAAQLHAYMLEHLDRPLPPMDYLCRRIGINEAYLRKAFHAAYGAPAYQFHRRQRLLAARHAVLTTGVPLYQLGTDFGFPLYRTFAAAFRQEFGTPPSSLPRPRP